MAVKFEQFLKNWPSFWIFSEDIECHFPGSKASQYNLVKRKIREGILIPLCRGKYLINDKIHHIDEFFLASFLYQPSFISFESALSFHGWIPEAVYTVTSTTKKRKASFENKFGLFNFHSIPKKDFYLGVERKGNKDQMYFIASPWRALADWIYKNHPKWNCLKDLEMDLRVEKEDLEEAPKDILRSLIQKYPSSRVRKILEIILQELT